jgi:hypothetical protein
VQIELYDSAEKARAAFDRFAGSARLVPEGSGDGRRLISKIIQPRTDGEDGFRLMKSFRSQPVFQKKCLLVYIKEDKTDLSRDRVWKDEIIREMSQILSNAEKL